MLKELLYNQFWLWVCFLGISHSTVFWNICRFNLSSEIKTIFKGVSLYFCVMAAYSLVFYLIGSLL